MAGKRNQVTLTFAGDAQALERTFDKVGSGTQRLEADLGRLGRTLDDGRGRTDRYGKGIEGVGQRADEMDTRMMGLADGITGTTELMRAGELSAAELAMAFADIGSSIYNTVAPSLGDLRNRLTGTSTDLDGAGGAAERTGGRMGGLGRAAALAGGVAGIGALAAGIDQLNKAQSAMDIEQMTTQFLATGDAIEVVADVANEPIWDPFAKGADELVGTFEALLRQSPDLAQSFVDQIVATEGASDATDRFQQMVDTARAANEGAAEAQESNTDAVRDYSDALNAAFDPVFGMYDALGQNREAQVAVTEAQHALNEAIREHGTGSAEAAAAEQALTDAQMANAESALGVTSAQNELIASIRSGETSVSNLRAQMQTWDQQGLLSQGVLEAVASQLGITTDEAIRLAGIDPNVDITAVDRASSPIQTIAANLGWLDGQTATVTIEEVRRTFYDTIRRDFGWGAATGGVVPQYLAGGGIGGPRGTDTVPAWLTPGEMVLNAAQQAELFALANGRGGGAGGSVVVNVAGSVISERELVKLMRDELSRGGFRGVR